MKSIWFWAASAIVAAGCANGKSSCVPGATANCACPGGVAGVQGCIANGTFGACTCPSGTSSAGTTSAGTSGSTGTGGSTGGSTGTTTNSSSTGTSGSSGGSSGGATTAATSSGTSSGTSGGVGGGTSGGTGCGGSTGTLPARVLATVDSFQGQVWDVTSPAMAQGIIGPANLLSDIPTAIAETTTPGDQEILVLLDTQGLVAFDSTGVYLGEIVIPVPAGSFQGGAGLAFVPQPCGAPIVVICGDQVTAFAYPGRSAFSAGGTATPTAIYSDAASGFSGCTPGPGNTFLATVANEIQWWDVLTDSPHGGGSTARVFAQSQGPVSGVAMDSTGEVFVAGDDGNGDGFVALFNPTGLCEQARSGGACTLTCNAGCTAGDPTLTGTPLYGAAAFNGLFLATASTVNTGAMNTILQLDPSNALAVSTYFAGPSGTDFYGLFAAPQAL